MSDTEWKAQARAYLEAHGLACEDEPDWVTEGRRPDFFCNGNGEMWVEVKTMTETEADEHIYRIFEYLRTHQSPSDSGAKGSVFAFISQESSTRDAKLVWRIAEQAATETNWEKYSRIVAAMPRRTACDKVVWTEFSIGNNRPCLLVCFAAEDHRYGYPYSIHPDPFLQEIELLSNHERITTGCLDDIVREGDFRIALDIHPCERPLYIASASRGRGARRSPNKKLIRAAVADGNSQLKNGIKYRTATGVIFLYQSNFPPADNVTVAAALLGDLAYSFPPDDFQNGDLNLTINGAWTSGQHTTTSALLFFRSDTQPLIVRNPWAANPLPQGFFKGIELQLHENGSLEIPR